MTTAKKTHWLRNTIIVLLICGIAGTALAAVLFKKDAPRTCATASLQFSFEGAAEGLAPNGDPFNTDELSSDAVLEAALEAAQLTGTYTADQLRDNLVVSGSYPENLVKQMTNFDSLLESDANQDVRVSNYHPTLFKVSLYNDFDEAISQEKLETLLKCVMEAYQAYFAKVYALNLDWLDSQIFELDQYDYPQQLEIIEEAVKQQGRYAAELYEKEPAFRHDGKTFDDISVRFDNLVTSDITRLNATITMNALSRNAERLLTQYQFAIRDLNSQLAEQTALQEQLDALIKTYEKNEIIYLNTADSLTKIDGNSSETYDTLVKSRREAADAITQINARLSKYQQRLSELVRVSGQEVADAAADIAEVETGEIEAMTEAEIAAAEAAAARQKEVLEQRIQALTARKDAATEAFKQLLQAFTDREINAGTVRVFNYRYVTPKLLSTTFIMKVIKTAGPICAVGFMLCMALLILSRRKEERAAK